MGFRKKLENFAHLDEAAYWREICDMNEPRLQAEHKILKQALISAGAGGLASYAAALPTGGLSLIMTAVSARRINVTDRQRELVRQRLDEKGWDGHELSWKDVAIGTGPCAVAEMIVPAGGAVAGHVLTHAAQSAAHHGVATAVTQHAAEAAYQQVTQTATEEAAKTFVVHHTGDAISAVAQHTTGFVQALAQGAQSEIFTATHGLIGHLSPEHLWTLSIDPGSAQAHILGNAAGQSLATAGTREVISKGASAMTKKSILKAIDREQKKAVYVTEREVFDDEEEVESEVDLDLAEIQTRARDVLLTGYYRGLGHRDVKDHAKEWSQHIQSCTSPSCRCWDYNRQPGVSRLCVCGHLSANHAKVAGGAVLLLIAWCESMYPLIQHVDYNGWHKTKLSQIDACLDCACGDYDLDAGDAGTNCSCGHRWSHHISPHFQLQEKLEWVSTEASNAYLKVLFSTKPGSRSRCA